MHKSNTMNRATLHSRKSSNSPILGLNDQLSYQYVHPNTLASCFPAPIHSFLFLTISDLLQCRSVCRCWHQLLTPTFSELGFWKYSLSGLFRESHRERHELHHPPHICRSSQKTVSQGSTFYRSRVYLPIPLYTLLSASYQTTNRSEALCTVAPPSSHADRKLHTNQQNFGINRGDLWKKLTQSDKLCHACVVAWANDMMKINFKRDRYSRTRCIPKFQATQIPSLLRQLSLRPGFRAQRQEFDPLDMSGALNREPSRRSCVGPIETALAGADLETMSLELLQVLNSHACEQDDDISADVRRTISQADWVM